jgi:decaprenyl-phosphate phosphoribosyltransferase
MQRALPDTPTPTATATATAAATASAPPVQGLAAALLRTARPRQWVKNVLVLAAPAAAVTLLKPGTALAAGWALLSFTLAAIGTYFVNDAADAAADRLHPTKRWRPVAAGRISPRAARVIGVGTAATALAAASVLGWSFTAVIATYLVLTAAYSARLKHVPVIDVLTVAAGFLLRAAGGAVATGVPLSNWFLLVSLFGSLHLVTAKRLAEQTRIGIRTEQERSTRPAYPSQWLHQILTMSLTGTVMSYALWAFQYIRQGTAHPILALSLVPFLAALMRYGLLVSAGGGEAPEKLLTSDRFLLVAGLSWAAMVFAGLYVM